MSYAKSEGIASLKVVKTKKQIISKIDSGVFKKSSTMILVQSHQPSTVSRASSRQSNFNVVENKSSNISTRSTRPASSFSTTRISNTSKLNLFDDNVQQGAHKLGTLPPYLRGKRPATATSKLKLKTTDSETFKKLDKANEDSETAKKLLQFVSLHFQNFRNNLGEQYRSYARSKAALDGLEKKTQSKRDTVREPDVLPVRITTNLEQEIAKICIETDQIDVESPPCEGDRSGCVNMQKVVLLGNKLEFKEVHGMIMQMEEKYNRHEADSRQKQERISELKAKVATGVKMIKEREYDIQKLKQTLKNLQLTSSSRDLIFRDGLQEVDQKIANLRKVLAQKYSDLIKSNEKDSILSERIEVLEVKLVEAGNALEESEKKIFELMENETMKNAMIEKQSKEVDAFRLGSEELMRRINVLTQKITEKDSLIAALKTGDPMKIAQTNGSGCLARGGQDATFRKQYASECEAG